MTNQKKRILVVDDEPGITRMLKLNLEATNEYEVKIENSSTNALATAQSFQPDLVLMDVLMPGRDGGELASDFKESSKPLRDVPIVFLTAAVTKTEVAARFGLIGGLPFLAKPVDIPEVIACFKKYLPSTV